MIKYFIVTLLTLSTSFSANAQGMVPVNDVAIVALVVTSGEETPVSKSVANTLESLGAQVLTANAPNASQMRSILKRFAAAAIDQDVALVFYDGAVLDLDGREFVAPGGITLRRRSDLLTKAIPLSALARATALAGTGGAVLVHSSRQGIEMIDGISLVEAAPEARTGTSPILFASAIAAGNLAEALAAMAQTNDDISLNDALGALAQIDGVSISQLPVGQAMLRSLPAPEPEMATVEAMAPSTDEAQATTNEAETGTVATLPQVGADQVEDDNTTADAQPEATPEDMADGNESADAMAADTATEIADTATEMAADTPDETAALAADSELSLDVLRAMQSSLSRGQKRGIQQQLRNLGFYRGLIDGIFGPQTARSISAYQESLGATTTGVLTPIQMEALSK